MLIIWASAEEAAGLLEIAKILAISLRITAGKESIIARCAESESERKNREDCQEAG